MPCDWLSLFRDAGTIWQYPGYGPHAAFQMASLHADFYFNTRLVAENSNLVDLITTYFSELCAQREIKPDWVASYIADIANGTTFAKALAKKIGAKTGTVDLQNSANSFHPNPGETVLVITDDIISGNSLRRTIAAIETADAIILSPILTLGNFFAASSFGRREIVALFEHTIETWPMDDCSLCRAGSLVLKTRSEWQLLIAASSQSL